VTWKKINASLIASTLYSDSTVANGSTYYYAATAVDIRGHESSKTAVVKAVIPFVTDEAGFAAKQPPLTHFESWGGALVSPPQVLLRNKVNSGLHSPSSCF